MNKSIKTNTVKAGWGNLFKLLKSNITIDIMMFRIKNINANMTHVVSYHNFLINGLSEGIDSGTTIKHINVPIELIFY